MGWEAEAHRARTPDSPSASSTVPGFVNSAGGRVVSGEEFL